MVEPQGTPTLTGRERKEKGNQQKEVRTRDERHRGRTKGPSQGRSRGKGNYRFTVSRGR